MLNVLVKMQCPRKNPCYKETKHKIVVIGGSHARGHASCLLTNLNNKDIDVYGIVKLGMGLNEITKSSNEDVKKMRNKDMIIVWGGTNDIRKNNIDKGQKHLQTFVGKKQSH